MARPVRHSARIAAQAGWHTAHALSVDGLRGLENRGVYKKSLTEITIDNACVVSIRKELERMGIDEATIYGDVPSVVRGIKTRLGYPSHNENSQAAVDAIP
jgi:hypothetical protein